MAALVFCVCSALEQLWDLAGAFVRYGYNPRRSFQYLRAKKREIAFRQNCREVWLEELSKRYALPIDKVRDIFDRQCAKLANAVRNSDTATQLSPVNWRIMQRAGIDFAAIEASAEAFEVIDSFAVQRRAGSCDETDNETHQNHEFVGNYDDIEVISPDEIDTTFYEYVDAVPVYQNSQLGTLKEGMSFTVTGYILPNCERLSINFVIENENRDVALHINPRLPQSYIVRNTKVKGVWGREEVSSALPFSLQRGHKFAIQVLITESSYLLSVNGTHFAKYEHRLPYTSVSTVEVKGDVDNVNMDIAVVRHYPDRLPGSEVKPIRICADSADFDDNERLAVAEADANLDEVDGTLIPREWRMIRSSVPLIHDQEAGLSLPYYGSIPLDELRVGRCLKIVGRVKLLPHSFYINLQRGHHFWPHPLVAFHFNPRFSKQCGAIGKAIVCRNAWYDGSWAKEERSELDTDFRPGKTFRLVIVCAENGFEVYLNHKLITNFKYHLRPNIVDTVYIQGDIKLWDVVLQSNLSPQGKRRIYSNPRFSIKDN